jgi:hypothetical protein
MSEEANQNQCVDESWKRATCMTLIELELTIRY